MPARQATPKSVLMCRPTHYTVSYRINPWMHPTEPTDTERALAQWQALHDSYVRLGFDIHLIEPLPGFPDMVYAANGGLVVGGKALGARFRYKERAAEGPAYMARFAELGFDVVEPVAFNEGEGDMLPVGELILAGSGFRSSTQSHHEVEALFDCEVISLELIDPRYYHLDTCLAVLDGDTIAYLPDAFSPESRRTLETRFPNALIADAADAAVFGLNLVSDGKHVVMAVQATGLQRDLESRGFTTIGLDVSELNLGGGGIKCCTLELRR